MEDYTPNSHRFKENRTEDKSKRKIEKVVKGKVTTKKKSEMHKLKDIFIAEDITNVKTYVIEDVIIPFIQKTICDLFADIPKMIFYGKSGIRPRSSSADRVSYNKYSDRDNYRTYERPRANNIFDFDAIRFTDREDANRVLATMDEIMDEYGLVRVSDFYDLAGEPCDFPGNDYGWKNIRNAEVVRVRDGYVIRMPRAIPIK